MRRALAALLLAVAAGAPGAAAGRPLTDGAGRRVALPARVERVFPAGPPAAFAVFALASQNRLGWTRPVSDEERAFMPPGCADLPALARLAGRGGTANVEPALALRPGLILDLDSISPTFASTAERTQTGLPCLLLEGGLPRTPGLLRPLSRVTGEAERGETLGGCVEGVLAAVRGTAAGIPPGQRPRVHCARGPARLRTAPSGPIDAEAFDPLGVRSVAGSASAARSIVDVSLEQVPARQPDVTAAIAPRFFPPCHRLELTPAQRAALLDAPS